MIPLLLFKTSLLLGWYLTMGSKYFFRIVSCSLDPTTKYINPKLRIFTNFTTNWQSDCFKKIKQTLFLKVVLIDQKDKGSFTNYVYKTRYVGGPKCPLFVNVYTIENVNAEG